MKKQGNSLTSLFVSILVIGLIGLLGWVGLQKNPNILYSQLVGRDAPVFVANTAQGAKFDLAEAIAQDRWVVINFWSTTCIVCREEAPELERFYREVTLKDDKNPLFVSINVQETDQQILRYIRDYRQTFPVVADRTGRISLDFGVTGTPETFFIDRAGKVRHRVAGEVDTGTMLRFMEWLERNPDTNAQQAMEGYYQARMQVGG